MPHTVSPQKILLISKSKYHEEIFIKLCLQKEFALYKIINKIEDIEESLSQQNNYDLIVFTNFYTDIDVVDYFKGSTIQINENIPILFIIQHQLTENKLHNFDKLNIKLLFEEHLSVHFLDYSLKNALQNYKDIGHLKENELRFRSLYDHTLDINLILDENDLIIDTNVQGRNQLKFDTNFHLKSIFLNKADYREFKKLLQESNLVSRFETIIKIKKTQLICLLDAFILYNNKKEILGTHIIIRNVDSVRKNQDLANRAGKLLVTGKFIRSLAHEIRNPLTNINLSLEQFNQEISSDNELKLYVDIVQRSADRITDLLEEIMNVYKTSEVSIAEENLHRILENSIRFANDRLTLQKIKLTIKNKIKNDTIEADSLKLSTVFLNLIVNSCEAIEHANGEIEISVSKKEEMFIIKFKDNGRGMDDVQTQSLFDPFYTGKAKGLGLGLTTAQNVIFAHNGTINVKSKKGKGTSFIVKHPIKV